MTEETRTQKPGIGDLVVCHDQNWRGTMHLPDEPGIVIGDRKDQARVFFPTIFGDCWISIPQLARIRNPSTASAVPAWMQRVWYLSRTLDAILLEIERFGKDGNAVRVFHGEIEIEITDRIRADLGEELRYYGMAPAGLHKIETSIGFVTVDRSPPEPVLPTLDDPPEA